MYHQSFEEYDRTDLVGKGSFGFVYKAIHKPTRQIVAVKTLSLDVAEQELADVHREIALLTQLKEAENVTKIYGAFMKGPQLWLIMDYCGGGSVRTLMKPGRIVEKYLTIIVREVVTALTFVHKKNIIHRDIKAANILVANDGRVQLCDFGVSTAMKNSQAKRSTFVGTPWWMAPEVILEKSYDVKADIWSLGITILEIAKGHPPYHDQEPMRALLMIPRQPPPRLEGGDWSQPLRDFVANCLCEEPDDRLPAEDLSKQKLLKSVSRASVSALKDLVTRLEQWQRQGNVRNSLISGPNGLDTIVGRGGDGDEISWDFEEGPEDATPTVQTYAKGHSAQASLDSFSSLDSSDTLKPIPSSATSLQFPAYTGTDHPLLQLFANDNVTAPHPITAAGQAPAILQPAFQPAPAVAYTPSVASFRSPASTRPASPEPLMTIDLPSFDEINGDLIAPKGTSPVPITQIELPSEEDFQTMRNTSTPLSQAHVIPSVPSAPMLAAPSSSDRPEKHLGHRPQRSDKGSYFPSKAVDTPQAQLGLGPGLGLGTGPISPIKKLPAIPPPQTPEEPRKFAEGMPVSAPSSPPKPRGKISHALPASSISNPSAINGLSIRKPHHLPSLSAPQVSYREAPTSEPIPPVPNISELTKNRSAESTPASKPRAAAIDPDQKTPVPMLVTSAQAITPLGGPHITPRGTGFKRADLSLKLPANPHHGIEIANTQPFPHSPGGAARFLSPLTNTPAFGSQTPTPTMASHAHAQAQALQQQQLQSIVQTDPWGMPYNVVLNPTAFFPSASNDDILNELNRMMGVLDTSLTVFSNGLKQVQGQMKGQLVPVLGPNTPPILKRIKKSRQPGLDQTRQSDTESFASESSQVE
ncbi:hypothetical protein DRE_05950 [Drechslerella stenobrocha 248]|uniref:non-specific serine/threonine protein kinase n=1 Tax=Drechslerella stenobrocha 248 TaxID=1043628 RepID=W7HZ43_9PEZI|nr:hypothetical protein DRE_05950 [Drechslerella stenobrocha 248]